MKRIVLAFSGGLDTSFCVVHLRETYGAEVVTVTADTGGRSPEELGLIAERSRSLGAIEHHTVDVSDDLYRRFLCYVIKANLRRGGVYPLVAGIERVAIAERIAAVALESGADALAHGSTRAGNDQIRFDVSFAAVAPQLRVLAPIRQLGWSRQQEAAWLAERGHPIDAAVATYSYNEGLWGVTIGGGAIHDPGLEIPAEAWVWTKVRDSGAAVVGPAEHEIGFAAGLPATLDGQTLGGPRLIARLNESGAQREVGRGVHVGETALGIKGRIAFEAPAAEILLAARKELAKLVLSGWQQQWLDAIGSFYGDFLHRGLYHEPVMRDLEAAIDSASRHTTGTVKVRLDRGRCEIVSLASPYSTLGLGKAVYGETTNLWDGADAAGFARILGIGPRLAALARKGT